jgi:hypothetical protein
MVLFKKCYNKFLNILTLSMKEFFIALIGVSIGGVITWITTYITNKNNTENLQLQLNHQTSIENKNITIEKLEEVLSKISQIHFNTQELSSTFIVCKEQNIEFQIFDKLQEAKLKELKVKNFIHDFHTVARILVTYIPKSSKRIKHMHDLFNKILPSILPVEKSYNEINITEFLKYEKHFNDILIKIQDIIINKIQKLMKV